MNEDRRLIDVLTPAEKQRIAAEFQRRMASCVPWSPAVRWAPELNFLGASYDTLNLFPEVQATDRPVAELEPGYVCDSPTQQFRYCVRLHRAGRRLLTWWGGQVGSVIFDADVEIPALFQSLPDQPGVWHESPWMSLTPAEILTLRPGTKLTKGRVIVAGLGLGHQLIEVSKRYAVKHITLVELDRELVEWMLPRVRPHVRKPLDVIVGDAYEIVPTLSADVALIDIFPGYGGNHRAVSELARTSRKIKKMWGWGTSEMRLP